ncbi:hypothetical protein ISCGN_019716 [Ixodes scapularis]
MVNQSSVFRGCLFNPCQHHLRIIKACEPAFRQVPGPFLFVIGSAMTEHVQKHDEQHDGTLLSLSVWSHQLVASAASGPKLPYSDLRRSPVFYVCAVRGLLPTSSSGEGANNARGIGPSRRLVQRRGSELISGRSRRNPAGWPFRFGHTRAANGVARAAGLPLTL